MPAKALLSIVALAALLAAAAWGLHDRGQLRRWWPAGVPMPAALSPADRPSDSTTGPTAGTGPRKCVGPNRVLYTDGACPAGTRAQALDGGSLSVLPAAPAAAPAAQAERPAVAASAQTPLRRLASEGGLPDQAERRVDQALHR